MKDFFAYLDKNKLYLTKHSDEYTKLIGNLNVVEKINNVVAFDESKILFASKNYLPRNISHLYQPIDRTNNITIYDSQTESFKKIQLFPTNLRGFSFLPFSRYLNFNGKLFISGGYQDTKLSNTLWAFYDSEFITINSDKKTSKNTGEFGKYSNLRNIDKEFDSSINDKSKYTDESNPNYNVVRCMNMISPRAGHAMIGLAPSLIFVFGGTESVTSCEMFHYDTNRWEEISSLNESRIDPSAFIYKNYIYVFFGLKYDKSTKRYSFIDTIERISLLNTQNSEWQYVSPKLSEGLNIENLGRSLCGIVIKANSSSSIYLCGGQVAKEKFSMDILDYDLELNTMSISEKKLPKPSAFLEQNFMYLFRTGINFDLYGDIFYYHFTDSFNFHFQKFDK